MSKETMKQEQGWTPERIAGMARLKDAQDKKLSLAKQEQGEPKKKWEGQIDNDEFFESLKQEQGEPVAGYFYTNDNGCYIECDPKHQGEDGVVPLYTTPQQRKPLTDEQKIALIKSFRAGDIDEFDLIDAIEAAHGIKE